MSITFPRGFVLTGAPCSGKTTTLERIRQDHNWACVEESGHRVFYNAQKDGELNPRISESDFTTMIFAYQKQVEFGLNKDQLTLFDRGIIDCIAYAKVTGEILKETGDLRLHNRYRAVFIFEPLPFSFDDVRSDFDQNNRFAISEALEETYRAFGHAVHRIGIGTVEERATLVVKEIEQYLTSPAHPHRLPRKTVNERPKP